MGSYGNNWLERARKDREAEEKKKNGVAAAEGNWLERARKDREIENSKNADPETIGNTLATNVNNWLQNHNTYVSDYQNRYSGRKGTYEDAYVSDSASWLDKVSKQKSNFDAEADSILAYMDQYKGYLDAKWMDDVRKTIAGARDQQKSIYDSAVSDNQWWSSFKDEDDYNFWRDHSTVESRQAWYAEKKKRLDELKAEKDKDDDYVTMRAEELYQSGEYTSMLHAMQTALEEYNNEIEALETDIRNYERGNYDENGRYYGRKVVDDYSSYSKLPDFNAVSSSRNTVNPTREDLGKYDLLNDSSTWNYDNNGILRDADGNEIKKDASGRFVNPKASEYAVKDRLGIFLGATDEEREEYMGTIVGGTWGDIIGQGIDGSWDQLEEDEIRTYYYILNSEGKESADKFLDEMKPELNRREAADLAKENAEKYQNANFFEKAGMNIATVPAQLFSGIAGAAENASYMLRGQDINPYSFAHSGSNYRNIVRGEAAADLDSTGIKIPGIDFTLGDAYQAGMSILDSFAAIGIGGKLGSVLLATGAASDEATRLYEQGATREQIALGSAAAGAAEMVFESLSIDKLINMKDAKTVGQIIINALVQGGIEASEEGFTEIANIITNSIIMGNQSDWNKLVEKYNGDKFSAFLEKVKDVTRASLSGFIAGTGSSVAPSAVSYAANKLQQNAEAKQTYGEYQAEIVEASLEIDPDNAYAKKLQAKLQGGKDLSGRQLRKLVEKNTDTFTKNVISKIQESAKKRLTDLGETSNVDDIAKLVAKQVAGEELTRSEVSSLVRSQYGSKVAKEIRDGKLSVNQESRMEESASMTSNDQQVISQLEEQTPANVSEDGVTRQASTGNEITPQKIVSIDGGEAMIQTDNGTISANDIAFGDENTDLLWRGTASFTGITPQSANGIIRAYMGNESVSTYLRGAAQEFQNGYYNKNSGGVYADKLTPGQREIIYALGQKSAGENTAKAQAKATAAKKAAASKTEKVGKVHFDRKGRTFDAVRETALTTMEQLSAALGVEFYVYESYKNAAGEFVYKDASGNEVHAPNGYYDPSDGSIHIDLNAGATGKGTMLFTVAHELTHFIKQWSPAKFKVLANVLVKQYSKNGATVDSLVEAQLTKAKNNNKEMTPEEAFEEVVADSMESILTSGNVVQAMAEVKKQDKGLWKKICDWFKDLAAKLRAVTEAYKNYKPDSKEGKMVSEMRDVIAELEKVYTEALVEASDNFQAAMESVVEKNAKPVEAGEIVTDGAVVTNGEGDRFSIRSMKHDIAEGKMFEDLKNVCGWTDAQVTTLRTQLKDLVEYMIPYREILDMNESYGMEGRRFSPYKPNSDPLYKISMDFSTLCSKRLLTQYVIENLQLRENRPMSAEEQMAIRDMLNEYRKVEKGLQVACAMCYVEAARLKSPKQIQRWLSNPEPYLVNYFAQKNTEFNATVKEAQADFKESRGYDRNAPKKDMKPADVKELNKIGPKMRSQYQLNAEERAIVERAKSLPNSTYLTAGNLATLSENEPVIYAAYTSFVRTATRSKSLETDEPYYYGDSTRDNGNGIIVSDSFIEAVNRENGMRFSSWSDWRIQHLLDYITAVIDNSVRGAAMHGYTKFGDEVRVLGKTGMMFNMSGVTGTQTGLNEDGSLNFSDTESIDVNEAMQLRKEFPETAGLQCIGVGNEHIIALLASDIIDYVIPYHVSGLNADLRRMAKIYGWADYTGTQNASIDKSIKLEDAVDKEHWHEEPVFSEFFVGYDTGMPGIEAMRASAEKYKQMCKDRGLKPKFEQFATEDNYWKLLIDRKMINQQTGNLIRQKAVTPTFDFDTIKSVVDKVVDNYDSGLEARALNHIVENWDSIPQRIKDLKKKGGTKAKKITKAANTLANQTVAAQPSDGTKKSDRSNGFQEHDVVSAVYTIRHEKAQRGHDLVKIGTMPKLYRDLFDLQGDVYVSNEHLYQNMVSRATAEAEGRFNADASADYHELGEEKVINAIEQFQDPLIIMESLKDFNEPRLVAVLDEKGNDGQNLMAVMELYAPRRPHGVSQLRNHVLITIYEKNSLPEYIEKTVDKGRILHKKEGSQLTSQAGLQLAGEMSSETLKKNVARFNKKVKDFKAQNKISYSDRAYMDAVERGDMETAQRMVDEAAKAAGFTSPKLYHGTPLKMLSASKYKLTDSEYAELDEKYDDKLFPFVVFKTEKSRSGLTYTATTREAAKNFAYPGPGTVFALYGKFENPLVVNEHIRESVPYYYEVPIPSVMKKAGIRKTTLSTEEIAHWAKAHGYDGVIVEGLREGPGYFTDDYIVFSSAQLKSADPVTYDDDGNVIPLSERFNAENDDIRYSDRDYMDAVEHADMDAVERMVDEAAKKAGFPEKLYHGTMRGFGFTKIDPNKSNVESAFFATDSAELAGTYSGDDGAMNISLAQELGLTAGNYQLYANTDGFIEVDAKGANWEQIVLDPETQEKLNRGMGDNPYSFINPNTNTNEVAKFAKKSGYPGVKVTNVYDQAFIPGVEQSQTKPATVYIFFNPQEQVKSADPVTYDDDGNVIPLSERFNAKNDDIRYSERDPEQEKVARLLEKENADLKEDVAHLRELVKLQSQVTDGTKFTKTSVEAAAGNLIKSINAKGDKKELAKLLNSVYEYIANGEEITFEGIKEEAQAAVNWLTSRVQADETPAGYSYDDELFSQEVMRQVYDSYWNVSTLRTVADKYQKQINQLKYEHSKRMSALREYHKEKTAKLKKEHKEKLQRVRQEYRERMDKQYKDITERYRESRKKREESREKTELRRKIRKTIRELDKILNRGNKKRNVKEDMKDFVAYALASAEILFTDNYSNEDMIRNGVETQVDAKENRLIEETQRLLRQRDDLYSVGAVKDELDDVIAGDTSSYDKRMEMSEELDKKIAKNMSALRSVFERERARINSASVSGILDGLAKAYKELGTSDNLYVRNAVDENVYQHLRSMSERMDGAIVKDMNLSQLEDLYKAYTMVLHTVRSANQLFVQGKTESIEQMAGRIMGDFSKRKAPESTAATVLRNLSNKIGWDYEKLYYALDRIGSEAFTELVMNIANSENIVMQDVMEAAAFRDEMVKKYGFNNWDVNKKIDREFLDNTGKKFNLTLGQMMALYAYSRREGAWDHIEYGGFVFGERELTNPRPADSYKLTKEQCEAITDLLTKEQKSYVEDMQKFLSETMGEKGNEVSMTLYGIKMFTEKNYFPIHVAGQFKAQAQESQAKAAAGFSSMSNAGFTHAQNPNAKAPFVLEGFNEIWVDHVNEMSRYHGTVPALEDMRRVMNRSSYSEAGEESMALKQMMENAYGKEAVDYFDNLYREANSGAITDKLQKTSKWLLSMFRKNSVAYSLSVLVQQHASLVRAYSMIDRKYFGFKGFGTITSGVAKAVSDKWTKAHTNAYNEMLKYAPGVTMAKEIGGFDTATGGSIRSYLLDTGKSLKQKWKTGTAAEKGKAVLDLVDDNAIANLPNLADKIAWIEIWNACKREAVAKHKDLAPNSEEFMQAVGERFTEVIRATQVYDSIFAKSPMLKSKNLAVQYLVSFMNEPNTVANMAESAVREATKGNWKGGLRTAGVLIHSIIFTNVMKSIIYAMRDDDENETYTEKYIEAVAGNMMSDFNPLNYIPVARDVVSLAQGYDVERADMAVVSDAIDAITSVIKNATKETDGMTEEQLVAFDKKVTEANWKLVETLASFFGIPVKNIRREIMGVINHAKIAHANVGKTTAHSAWEKAIESAANSIPFVQTSKAKQDKLYEAIISGDKTYVARLKAGYKDDAAYNSAVRKALRENDPRIHEAAQARYNGNIAECKRIYNEIKNEGNFSPNDILEAINSEESKIRNEEKPETMSSSYSSTDFVNAVIVGDTSLAATMKDDIISAKVANGKSKEEAEEAFISSVSTATRNAFDSSLLDEAGAKKMLLEYADMDEEEADSKVRYWAMAKAYPQYRDDLSEARVEKYNEFAKPAGISLDVFVQYLRGTSGLETKYDKWGDVEESVRDQVLAVIDSLPITWEQKDALYLAAGYAESNIWDVPW